MSERRLLASGDVLADRYALQDLVSESLGSTTWRAHDTILNRNVGLEMLPSDDPRAERFLAAARDSTAVTDPRFLRVLDLIEDDQHHHLVVREWARAFSLDQVLKQSPMPARRAATVVAEVAEALAHAHELGIYHRRLTPHQVLLKQSGAVRVVGLGIATALAPPGTQDTFADQQAWERLDVQALGQLLYACLTSRWPGAAVDGLRAAPTEHGRLLRPRQVRAGVSRDIDTVCDRILGTPPRHHLLPLGSATDIARALQLTGVDADVRDDQPSLAGVSSPDLLRLDPVIVPAGPPPGLEPPRRRPKAFEPPPPTTLERARQRGRRATRGDRGLVLLGIGVGLVLAAVLGFLVTRSTDDESAPPDPIEQTAPIAPLTIRSAVDFDPQGQDGQENRAEVASAIDGDPATGWRTSTYFGSAQLGGLKDGVGLVVDLGGPRLVENLRVHLAGSPTNLQVYASDAGSARPTSLDGLRLVASLDDVGTDASVSLPEGVLTRHVVIWLTKLPQVAEGEYRGEVREIEISGHS